MTTSGMLIALIFTPWGLPIGVLPVTIALIGWFWPKEPLEGEEGHEKMAPDAPGPVVPEARA
jgi:hypothetical protein